MKAKTSLIVALVALGMNLCVARSEYDTAFKEEEEVVVQVKASETNSTSSSTTQLHNVLTSIILNQNFSSYAEEDLEEANKWFLNPSNHPIDESNGYEKNQANPNDDHYMKERATLGLMYFSNCKDGCTLPKSEWLSKSDHCQWRGVTCNGHQEIVKLFLREKGLSGQFTMFELDHLETMNLRGNNLSGKFTIAGGYVFSMNALQYLHLGRNSFTGIEVLQHLTNLETLVLFRNRFEGEFQITEETFPINLHYLNFGQNLLSDLKGINLLKELKFLQLRNAFVQVDECIFCHGNMLPTSISWLDLSRNNLSCFDCLNLGRLINLQWLLLGYNSFGLFTITEYNFPTKLKFLDLRGNGLVHIESLSLDRQSDLEVLNLMENSFSGQLMLTSYNLPQTLQVLIMNDNKDLTGIDASNTAVPNLRYLLLHGIDGITIGYELCDRNNLDIQPSDSCKRSHLMHVMESFFASENMSPYPQSDLEVAKTWFLKLESHPFFNWNEVNNRPTRERFTLALLHSTNCKDGCTLTSDTRWLTATHHCDWEGVVCNNDKMVTTLNLESKGLSQKYIMYGTRLLEELNVAGNNLSGTFVVAIGNPWTSSNVNKLNLANNQLTGFADLQLLQNLNSLNFVKNNLEEFVITATNFPLNIEWLNLKWNSLQSIEGVELLKNLKGLHLSYNNLSGSFDTETYKIPVNIEHLTLDGNTWTTAFTGFENLKKLKTLGASDIDSLQGEYSFGVDGDPHHLPASLETFRLNGNTALTKLSFVESDFPQLKRITLYGIKYIELDQWVCDKEIIYPPELCL